MMPTVAELPDDVDALKAMVLATVEQRAAMEAENSRIASEIAALKLINTTSDTRIAELTAIVKTFERMLYGTRSERLRGERLDDEQIDFVFDEIETGIRDQLRRMLARGFDAGRDIAGITVNRWSHGYAYDPSGLTTDGSVPEETMALARRPIGRVVIANSDAGWSAYAQTAVDQAWRAVQELG